MLEESESRSHKTKTSAIVITSAVIGLALFFGALLITRSLTAKPGKIIFQETATEENRDFVNSNLNEIELKSDVIIGTTNSTTKSDNPDYVLYNILLPVTDFYSSEFNISAEQARSGNLVSIWDLNASQRLLNLDGNYYFDNYNNGAFFEYFTVTGTNTQDIQKVVNLLQDNIADFPDQTSILSFAQTGVTALSRRMNAKLAQVGDAKYFSKNIGKYLSGFDLTHTSNESSFSSLANDQTICSQPNMIDVLTDIGLDIVELTGNHNQDCGDAAAIATIEQYKELGIRTVGGGVSATTAAIPLEINGKDTRITLLAYNLSTGGYTLDNTPGANFYTKEKAQQDINAAKARGDFIIVDVQYYECNNYAHTTENTTCDRADSTAGDQVKFFRELVDMGANIVVGTSAHQPQTFELYHGSEIYYGLGNLFFDQSSWPGTTRSLILEHYFWKGKLLQTHIVPTFYDSQFQTQLMDSEAAANFLTRLIKTRPEQE